MHSTITGGLTKPRSLAELIDRIKVPANTVAIFWPGGTSVVFKSSRQRVYLLDPSGSGLAGGSGAGVIDIRPDLVFCSLAAHRGLDVSTMKHLATAFPEARFVGPPESRDAMIGRDMTDDFSEVPINPDRIHTLEHETLLDVRRVGLADSVRIRILPGVDEEPRPPWNLIFGLAGLQVCLIRKLADVATAEAMCEAIRRRVDVLLWSFPGAQLDFAADVMDNLRPGYAVPIGYDGLKVGRDLSRKFKAMAAKVPGVQTYLFAEDYMEGMLYTRITSRRR